MKKILFIIYFIFISSIIPFYYLHRYGKTVIDNHGLYHQLGSAGNDNYTHSRMIKEMANNVSGDGIKLYVNNFDPSYNFPLFQYYNFSPYLLSSFLYFFSSNPNQIYILSYFFPLFFASLAIYLIARENNPKNIFFPYIAPLLFVLSPYMIVDVLQRNAYSEVWAFSFLPVLYYLFKKILKFPTVKNIIVWTICFLIFLTSHNITTLYMLALSIPFLISQYNSKRISNKFFFLIIAIPFLLSIFYLGPIYLNYRNLVVSDSLVNPNLHTYLSSLSIVLSPTPLTSNRIIDYIFPIQLGLPIIFSLILLFIHKRSKEIICILILMLFVCFPVWDIIPSIFYSIQFPYRLLVFIIFLTCIYVSKIQETIKTNCVFLILVAISLSMYCPAPDILYTLKIHNC